MKLTEGSRYTMVNGKTTGPIEFVEEGEWTCIYVGVYWDSFGECSMPEFNLVNETIE